MDKTEHNYELPHARNEVGEYITHSKEWYAFWGNKCPVCQAEAIV